MARYVAFLGGINVGGHRVKMDRLRDEVAALGLTDVSTFIASGNVIFSGRGSRTALEGRIEDHLGARLGFAVPTFVRPVPAVRKVLAVDAFGPLATGDTYHVAFLRAAPTAAARAETEALSNATDTFRVHGTELHWRIRGGMSATSVRPAVLARALGVPSTSRNTTSLRKLLAQLG
jgi:uncharacterized protein (DUF1697 family)